MSENSEEQYYNGDGRWAHTEPGEEVVISGIAGRFPDSDDVDKLRANLFNKVDLVTADDRRWQLDHPEIPQRTGKIRDVGKFDSLFFGVHFKQAHTMDPMCRMMLEHAYEAIVDAGINPRQLRGTNTGVFIGACFSESEKTWFYEKLQVNGFGITGCSRAMLANRVSYWLGSNGPSYTVDSACSSSLSALDHAYKAIRDGQCDAALVGGSNLCLHPYVSLQFFRLGVLSPEGVGKPFDADANGYARSETVAMIFLQKSKDAKRIYSRVIHTKTNCNGYRERGVTFPTTVMQTELLGQFYDECQVAPSSLAYVEAYGTATATGDTEEANALGEVFCPGRTTPLRIGSVKSNLGHSEPASGLCSIAKVIVAMESGHIPPNLHYNRPREGVKALEDGRIQVVTETTPWEGGYVGINSFGLGGANAHILLKSHTKDKINNGVPQDSLPRLVVVSGRTEEAVTTLLDGLESRPVDVEYISLFHDIHADEIPGHLYRGFTILPALGLPEKKLRDVQHYPGAKRPIWFVFSGMGSQWAGMGEALFKIPVFAKAIQKCDAVLKPHGVNIIEILTSKDPHTFDNILNSFVGIAAVQIGLVDVLESIGIVPDHIIGHSVGELGCAYADGCFTAEQMVLAAYSRGLASIETEVIRGSMAAVGRGYNDIKGLCPPDIEVACHNGAESSTISGPAESMKEFVAKLQAGGIFAREVPCSNIAYHSRYIAAAGPKLLAYLQKVVPDPKPRSEKWLSTSVPRSKWNTSAAQLCSAEYHTNNLLSPVLFEETSASIPKDAITIEIAPHGLLQAILRRSLGEEVTNIALTKRGHRDNTEVLLQAIGKMYEVGLRPQLSNFYPKIEYPVSRGTPLISPLIRWEHSDDWFVTTFKTQEKIVSGERNVQLSLADEHFGWIAGHVIDDRNLLPATGYLALIWESLGTLQEKLYTEVSVVFEDVKFHRATIIPKQGSVQLTVMLQKGSGRFEIIEGETAVVTGLVRATPSPGQERVKTEMLIDENDELDMTEEDIYKELNLRGYQYSGLFRGLEAASTKGTKGRIAWTNNWVTFLDNMLQMKVLGLDTRELLVPTSIQKLVIDTKAHLDELQTTSEEDDQAFAVHVHEDLNIIVSGGVEIRGLKTSAITRRKPASDPVLENFQFVVHRDRAELPLEEAIRIATQIVLENHAGVKVQTLEVIDSDDNISTEGLTSPLIQKALGDVPLLQADINIVAPIDKFDKHTLPPNITVTDSRKLAGDYNALLGVGHNLLANKSNKILEQLRKVIKNGGFLLAREPLKAGHDIYAAIRREDFDILLEKRTKKEQVLLLRIRETLPDITAVIKINNNEFSWLSSLQAALKAEREKDSGKKNRILVVGEGDFESGLIGLVNCLRKEPGGESVQGLLIQDMQAPKFSLENEFYAEQLQLGLALNVLRPRESWGSYRFFPLDPLALQSVHHAKISQLTPGDLSTLRWVEGRIQPSSRSIDTVNIHYSSINFGDIMISTGKLAVERSGTTKQSLEDAFGLEFSGRDINRRPVMGIVESGAISNLCIPNSDFLWPVPDQWTLEDAATVPVAYATAYYALYLNGAMEKGDKVLIHAGSGGVGQAAITLALHDGCEVFTTVGSLEKREFIKKQFPQIDDDHIGNSRDTSFEQLVLRQTQGKGVDIILNSLAEEKLQASVRCLACRGRFLEIGKFDFAANNSIGMEVFLKEVSFHGVLLDNLFAGSTEDKRELSKLFVEGIRSGVVKPLVRTVFPMNQTEAAFRHMAAGKHIGKVLIRIREKDEVGLAPLPLALPRYYCLEASSYLILDGLGGFGLELADWLVQRGARKLVLTSRTGVSNGYQKLRINIWKSYGVEVVIVVGKDASTPEGCEAILKQAAALGPVDAIFNLSAVLKDNLCENQTPESFEESLRVKAWATTQLDHFSRTLCPDLRQFVVFSSVASGRGNAGQTNYGMANSIIERICETRAAENLPGLAVQWGAVGDAGLIAEKQGDNKEGTISGTLQQKISSCLQQLDGFLHLKTAVVSSMIVAAKKASSITARSFVDVIMDIMGLKNLTTVSLQTPLIELGMDSMMAVEVKQTLAREFEVFLTEIDIRTLTYEKLQEMYAKQLEEEQKRERREAQDMATLKGIKMLVRTLRTDQLNKDTCVKLVTESKDGRSQAFILPGIEGTHTVFDSLAGKLKFPATCLQLGTVTTNLTSIESMADYLMPHLQSSLNDRRDFVVVGYSFGSLVAIELVRRLEAEGRRGRLVLIDGSPDSMRAIFDQHLFAETEDQLQTNVLSGIMDILVPSLQLELDEEFKKCDNWEQRLLTFTNKLPKDINLNLSVEDQKAICTSIYCQIKAAQNYDPSTLPPLKTPITLLKPIIESVRSMSNDYGLQALTRQPVDVHEADGNHATILDADICAAAINGEPLQDAESFRKSMRPDIADLTNKPESVPSRG